MNVMARQIMHNLGRSKRIDRITKFLEDMYVQPNQERQFNDMETQAAILTTIGVVGLLLSDSIQELTDEVRSMKAK